MKSRKPYIRSNRVLCIIIALTIILSSFPPRPLLIQGVNANTQSTTPWHSVFRGVNSYDVYKIEDGDSTIGVYAQNQDGTRVVDPSFEELLVYDAATLDKPSNFPVPSALNAANYPNTWGGVPYYVSNASPAYTIYPPAFMDFADPPDFLEESILQPGLGFDGLNDFDHRSELYKKLVLTTVLQSALGGPSQIRRKDRMDALFNDIEKDPDIKNDIAKLEFAETLHLGADVSFGLLSHQEVIGPVLSEMTTRVSSFAGAGMTTVKLGLVAHNLNVDITYNNLYAALEFQLALEDANQRLEDLKQKVCGGSCTEAQVQNDALAKGLVLAESKFWQLYLEQDDTWLEQLTDPEVAKDTLLLVSTVTILIIQIAGIFAGVAAAPVVLVGGLIITGVTIFFNAAIDSQEGLDNFRSLILSNTLHHRLLDGSLPFDTNRRYALSLLNMAYYSLAIYFDQIYLRASNDEQYWIFEEDPGSCYGGNFTEICTINKAAIESYRGRDWTAEYFEITQYGTFLTPSERTYWKQLILPRNAVPSLDNPGVAPTLGTSSTQFIFSVNYFHPSNIAATSISLFIDGTEYPVSLLEGDPMVGIPHSITLSGFEAKEQPYSYYFEAVVGSQTIESGQLSFSVIDSATGHDLTLLTTELSDDSAEPGDSVDVRGQVNNIGDFREDDISIDVNISGPGGYSWTDSLDIGSLDPIGGNYIWGPDDIATWNIPSNAADGDYSINITVLSPNGDENWSDNIKIRSVYVSDGDPLIHMAYSYQNKELYWASSHPELPSPYDGYGAFGPATTSYGGKTYKIWGFPTNSGDAWRYYIKDTSGTEYLNYLDNDWDKYEVIYEDNHKIMVAGDWYSYQDFARFKIGHPASNATIDPLVQSVPMNESGVYDIYIPCGSCNFNYAAVYEASGGDDPPHEFFDSEWPSYAINDNGPAFDLSLAPYSTDVKNFAFDTNDDSLNITNYILYGRVDGYQPVDSLPSIDLTFPLDQQIVSNLTTVNATAVDDKGIDRVEFLIDNVVKHTDLSSPYTFEWATTQYSDGSHDVTAKAVDTVGQSSSATNSVVVDNLAPGISNVGHTPQNPTDSDSVSVQATIDDVVSIVVANLLYSSNDGLSWSQTAMSNGGGNVWEGSIPAHDQGDILYKIEATDELGHSGTTSNYDFFVTDATNPTFYGWVESPIDLSGDHTRDFRITVAAHDIGGSGLEGQTAQLDYRIGSNQYNGYEDMTSTGANSWYFDISSQNWAALSGQTVYYMVRINDGDGNEGVSSEQDEYIDAVGEPKSILLVDDDDNSPDVRGFYTSALDALGLSYDIWDTINHSAEPDANYLAAYAIVIWFSGDAFDQSIGIAGPGPQAENALGEWLDNGSCLFLSSQDYFYDKNFIVTPFMNTYLGAESIANDVGTINQVIGQGPVFGGLGPYDLIFPGGIYPDDVVPTAAADLAFEGDNTFVNAIFKDNGIYRTTFWALPFEAVSNEADRQEVMDRIVNWCRTRATQEIPLSAGWNMISTNVEPVNPAMSSVLSGIVDDFVLIKNGGGDVYWPSNGNDDIGDWNVHHGYQVYLDNAATLKIVGTPVDPVQTPIDLQVGWNLVAYLSDTEKPVGQALISVDDKLYLAKNGAGRVYWPFYGTNQIGDMQPGQGYYLYLTAPASLTYPAD